MKFIYNINRWCLHIVRFETPKRDHTAKEDEVESLRSGGIVPPVLQL